MANGTPDEPGASPWDIPAADGGAGGGAGGHLPAFGQAGQSGQAGQPGTGPAGGGLPPFAQPLPPGEPTGNPGWGDGSGAGGVPPFAQPGQAAQPAQPYDNGNAPAAGNVPPFLQSGGPSGAGMPPFATANQPYTSYPAGSDPADQGTQVVYQSLFGGQPRLVLPPSADPGDDGNAKRRKTILISGLAAAAVVGVTVGVVAFGGGSSQKPVALSGQSAGTTTPSGNAASSGAPVPNAPGSSDSTATDKAGAPLDGSTGTPSASASGTKPGSKPATSPAKGATASGANPSGGDTTAGSSVTQSQAPVPLDASLALHWRLNEPSGTAVADTSGHGRSGTLSGPVTLGSTGHGGSATFTGPPGQIKGGVITAAGPAVDTTKSFTVSVWLNQTSLSTPTKYATVLSQDGKTVSGFWFSYSQATGCWGFGRAASDVAVPATDEAWSKAGAVPLNTWAMLTGVYDTNSDTLALYINGALQSTTRMSTAPYASTGAFVLGRSWYNTYPSNPFTGGVSDVRVYNRALTAAEVQSLTKL